MYHLEGIYGRTAFKEFDRYSNAVPRSTYDLNHTKCSNDTIALDKLWEVHSFQELLGCVSFLTAMNKRLVLYFRGQDKEYTRLEHRIDKSKGEKKEEFPAIIPQIFRPGWKCFDCGNQIPIQTNEYWKVLGELEPEVKRLCIDVGVPRPRTLETREVLWAIIQHYGLWPTPLIDVTMNLRIAASFALGANANEGILYVVGMPNCTGSITFDIDQQLVLARLQSCCPPIAKRPHYQDGFLVGRFPFYEAGKREDRKSNLRLRLIAKFRLTDKGEFWDPANFPKISNEVLYPSQDSLLEVFRKEFGQNGPHSVCQKALSIKKSPTK